MLSSKQPESRIYLDYASATPLHPKVKDVMLPFLEDSFGNPSAIHAEGVFARQGVEIARQKVATTLGIKPTGVIFTSGGTESNNLAILGLLQKLHAEGRAYSEMEFVTTRIEHPSISELLPILSAMGIKTKFVDVDEEGKISVPALEAALTKQTVLVTSAYANSEVGVIQSVSRLSRVVRQFEKKNGVNIFVHTDAAQAPLWLPCELERLGVDMISIDVGKCNGPKGIGILAMHGKVSLLPILHGGGQEQGLRPGTENVAGIVGAAEALLLAQATYEQRAYNVSLIRNKFIETLNEVLPEVVLNGPKDESRLANNINISLPGLDTEYLVVYLDSKGIAASTKSACAGAGSGESTVVKEMTKNSDRAKSTLRLTLSDKITDQDMKYVLDTLVKYKEKMKSLT